MFTGRLVRRLLRDHDRRSWLGQGGSRGGRHMKGRLLCSSGSGRGGRKEFRAAAASLWELGKRWRRRREEGRDPAKSGCGGKRFRTRGAECQGICAGATFAGTGSSNLEPWSAFSFTFEPGHSQCQTYFSIMKRLPIQLAFCQQVFKDILSP